jgi:phosphoribosylanthranilate isomerase
VTHIKFCGMTREQDVTEAAILGVDALGFVLWAGSPRAIAADRLRALVALVPSNVVAVGVFVRPTADDLQRAFDAGIAVAQLHGTADAPGVATSDVWIAASLATDGICPAVSNDYMVLLDAHDPERHGGTGRTIDWSRAARVAAARPVMLAGGLTAANVADAIRLVRPYGVDVASGIEDAPGIKNARAMRDFVAAVRQAEQ